MSPSTDFSNPKRADLHCHSDASNKTSEAVLNAIHCPESYSRPQKVYEQARRRGMNFVTLTDHDTIEGALELAALPDTFVGEELTCWFPEDQCKMHVLVYGISREQHVQLQSIAKNIYDVADFIERHNIAHSVAHPIYRQNDRLERWHVERLLLLFKGFECLNGAHSALHREAFEPLLDRLDERKIQWLSEIHELRPRWTEPWKKSRTAGTDDHGLLNVGRTFTEFPSDVNTALQVLDAIRSGRCRPGGEPGSSAKLAHTFYSIAVRYYGRHVMAPGATPNFATQLLQTIVGERPASSRTTIVRAAMRSKLKKLRRAIARPFVRDVDSSSEGSGVIKRLFLKSAATRIREHQSLFDAAAHGLPPLGEHEEFFDFVSKTNRDVIRGIADAIQGSVNSASFTGLFDSIAAVLAHQFTMLPYYFAVFHQNKERHLLRELTGLHTPKTAATLKVGLFTDTFDEVNGVGRFLREMATQALSTGSNLIIHTCGDAPGAFADSPVRKNFEPLLSRPLPYYEELNLHLPPLLEILEWADRHQFDVIQCSTPGPMGLCGWVVSKMLRIPMLGTYHTDFPAYAARLSGDHRVSRGTIEYMKWFYARCDTVFSRSTSYRFKLSDIGVHESRIKPILPCVNTVTFNPSRRDASIWGRWKVTQPVKLVYAGRVSAEKNLPLLRDVFAAIRRVRPDVALVVAGQGPYLKEMKQSLNGLPAYFTGNLNDAELAAMYASADLLVFPSRTDTLGQVVMEAQACGLPAVVSAEGGPKETVVDNVTGIVLSDSDVTSWTTAVLRLLGDDARRRTMSQEAAARMGELAASRTFEQFWNDHLRAVESQPVEPSHHDSKQLSGL